MKVFILLSLVVIVFLWGLWIGYFMGYKIGLGDWWCGICKEHKKA